MPFHRNRVLTFASTALTAVLVLAALAAAATTAKKPPAKASATKPATDTQSAPPSMSTREAERSANASTLMQLNSSSVDSASAARAIPQIRSIIASEPDSALLGLGRQVLMRALIMSNAAPIEIANAADTTAEYVGGQKTAFYSAVAGILAERGEELERAQEFAERSLRDLPSEDPKLQTYATGVLATVHLKRGNPDEAIPLFEKVLPTAADSQTVLRRLGVAHEMKGQNAEAIDYYVRSMGVFPGKDTTGLGSVRALHTKQYGSTKGLDAKIDAARKASIKNVALDPRRHDKPAPAWKLTDLSGKPIQLADFKGKVLVLDFWGSWCGPCRAELPFFQSLYERYGKRGVAFVGMNWERMPTDAERIKAAKTYMETNKFTFPVAMNHDQDAVVAYGVSGFPTAYVIDKTGTIRYKNTGMSSDIDEIMSAQVESLLR